MRSADPSAIERLILGHSKAIDELRREIRAIARSPAKSLLVVGETGVGKDLVPPALLASSPHLRGSLEVFNCPAVPSDHLESELFGTARGAYPGAIDRAGAAERAAGGLLLLDEIAAMSLEHQGKVLRLLDSGEGRRLGAVRAYRVEATFVAATNENLQRAISERRFREDLYYRLVQDAVVRVPPLRERSEDVPLLARAFLGELPGELELTAGGCDLLAGYGWPGNVRELRAVVRSAARLAEGPELGAPELAAALERIPCAAVLAEVGTEDRGEPPAAHDFRSAVSNLRRQMLIDALAASGGNQTLAGVMLGMHTKRGAAVTGQLDPRARKLAHRKFGYWWKRLVVDGESASFAGSYDEGEAIRES
jgi:sigma-54-dependent transcriptional regulator